MYITYTVLHIATHCYTLMHACKQTSHVPLHVLRRLQRMCLQPPEAIPPCNRHTACHHIHVPYCMAHAYSTIWYEAASERATSQDKIKNTQRNMEYYNVPVHVDGLQESPPRYSVPFCTKKSHPPHDATTCDRNRALAPAFSSGDANHFVAGMHSSFLIPEHVQYSAAHPQFAIESKCALNLCIMSCVYAYIHTPKIHTHIHKYIHPYLWYAHILFRTYMYIHMYMN
jgi:hypothetical protein